MRSVLWAPLKSFSVTVCLGKRQDLICYFEFEIRKKLKREKEKEKEKEKENG
jgi:hypothetical protein